MDPAFFEAVGEVFVVMTRNRAVRFSSKTLTHCSKTHGADRESGLVDSR